MAQQSEGEWPPTEQEERMQSNFKFLDKAFKKVEKISNPDKAHKMLKEITEKLKESKALLKEFEREARTDGMPAALLAERKKVLANQVNNYISMNKEVRSGAMKDDLFSGAVVQQQDEDIHKMSNQQLMARGRKQMTEIDDGLDRAARLVEDTTATATQTAAAINDQTEQLNKIVDDLNDIEFNVKKAAKVITDITRGLLTDKCIGFLLFCAIGGVICVIVLKVVNPNKSSISAAINNSTLVQQAQDAINNAVDTATSTVGNQINNIPTGNTVGRRMLYDLAGALLRAPAAGGI